MNIRRVIVSVFLLNAVILFASDLQEIENDLLSSVKRLNYWRTNVIVEDINMRSTDSIYYLNNQLKNKLLDYTVSEPATLTFPFDSLKKYINIVSSKDSLFRIYSWNVGKFDKMEYFINIYQYKAEDKVYAELMSNDDEYDPKGYYSRLHTLKNGADTTIYMVQFHAFYSPKDFSDSYQTFQIVGTHLVDSIPLFMLKDTLESSVEVLYDPSSQKKSQLKKLIRYKSKKRQFKIRQTDDYGIILSKSRKLIFNGQYFEYKD